MSKVYKLSYDLDRMKFNEDYDYWQVDNTRSVKSLFWKAKPIEFPDTVRFEGRLKRLEELDFPYYINSYPFMSRRMLKVILGIKPFSYQDISIPIYECNTTNKSKFTDKFVLVNLLKHTQSILDPILTKYYEDMIDEPAFKEPAEGYPSLFRINAEVKRFFRNLAVSFQRRSRLYSA